MCTCVETSYDGSYYVEKDNMDPASYGATNCSDLTIRLRMESNGARNYDCRESK